MANIELIKNFQPELKEKIVKLVLEGNLEPAYQLIQDIDVDTICELLMDKMYKQTNINFYGLFVHFLFKNPNDYATHFVCAVLLSNPLCHFHGAYNLAAYHTEQTIKLSPNDTQYPEYLGFLDSCPDRILSLSIGSAFLEQVYQGKFIEALLLVKNFKIKEISQIIRQEAARCAHITFYGFFVHLLLLEPQNSYLHYQAASLLLSELLGIEGANTLALYHLREALALDTKNAHCT